MYIMVNEGAKILEEGIAARPLDVDVIWIYGYGFHGVTAVASCSGPIPWASRPFTTR